MAATTRKKKASTRSGESARSRSAKKAAATRRLRARERAEKQARALAKRRATLARKAEEKRRRSEAAKKGARIRRAKDRARGALSTFLDAVDQKARDHVITRVRESWHRAKRDLERDVDDVERYLEILDDLADDEGTEWDIAYGSTENAA